MKYPKQCPVFELVGLPEFYDEGMILVGTGFYSMGLETVDPATGHVTEFHVDWLVPLTDAAKEMLASLAKWERWEFRADDPVYGESSR